MLCRADDGDWTREWRLWSWSWMIYQFSISPKQELWELKIWSAFILNLTASSANKIESLLWLADEHDVIWRQVIWSDNRDHFTCVFRRRSLHEKITSFDIMTKYWMCPASLDKGSEHVRACSELRAERENKDRTAQVIKDEIYKLQVLSLFLFGLSQ